MTFEKMRAVSLGLQPFSRLDSPREVVRQFTPNWFAATMGTGILSIALAQTSFRAVGEARPAQPLSWLRGAGVPGGGRS